MIIVNQEKTYLVNFNNVCQVSLAVNEEETEYAIAVQTVDKEQIIMGEYKTEERAKEVLEEIYSYRAIFEYFKYVSEDVKDQISEDFINDDVMFDTYEMPNDR